MYQARFFGHQCAAPVRGAIAKANLVNGRCHSDAEAEGEDPSSLNDSQGQITAVAARAVTVTQCDDPAVGKVASMFVDMEEVSLDMIEAPSGQRVAKGDGLSTFSTAVDHIVGFLVTPGGQLVAWGSFLRCRRPCVPMLTCARRDQAEYPVRHSAANRGRIGCSREHTSGPVRRTNAAEAHGRGVSVARAGVSPVGSGRASRRRCESTLVQVRREAGIEKVGQALRGHSALILHL
ncbi:hypothetical protein J2W46_003111 [Paraburkholderia strydomiana]|nr:hypothetical protein [Paraburkholderia strydomiana]